MMVEGVRSRAPRERGQDKRGTGKVERAIEGGRGSRRTRVENKGGGKF